MNAIGRRAVSAGAALCFSGGAAWAHASERGYVLLLPTDYYLFGGMLAVALSFLILVFLPVQGVERLLSRRILLLPMPLDGRAVTSTLSFLALAAIVYAGFRVVVIHSPTHCRW